MSSRFSNDSSHVFALSLCSLEGSQLLLGKLSSSLFLRVSDQLDNSSLVRSQSGDFSDQVSHKGGSLGFDTFSVRNFLRDLSLGHLVSFVETKNNT
jgi:hypothetical protein